MLSQVFFTTPLPATKKNGAGAKVSENFIGTVSYGSCHTLDPAMRQASSVNAGSSLRSGANPWYGPGTLDGIEGKGSAKTRKWKMVCTTAEGEEEVHGPKKKMWPEWKSHR